MTSLTELTQAPAQRQFGFDVLRLAGGEIQEFLHDCTTVSVTVRATERQKLFRAMKP
jgi:hypothetical protein